MKVGTDGVLLGAWSDVAGACRALDVGTGCGVIALMLAQRACDLIVDAIDIDGDSVQEAARNFERSAWSARLRAIECNFLTFEPEKKYDLIVSNPPFFTNGVLPPKQSRMNARHTQSLTTSELINKAAQLLHDDGKIAIVTPANSAKEILDACCDSELNVSRYTEVFSVTQHPVKRLLWEIAKTKEPTLRSTITIEKYPGEYTEEYRALCRDFYLNL